MASPSPADVEEKFQTFGPPTNLDSCALCGAPRSAHDPGASCPTSAPHGAWVILLILGGLLTVTGLILSFLVNVPVRSGPGGAATLVMVALLSGLTLLITGVVLRTR